MATTSLPPLRLTKYVEADNTITVAKWTPRDYTLTYVQAMALPLRRPTAALVL